MRVSNEYVERISRHLPELGVLILQFRVALLELCGLLHGLVSLGAETTRLQVAGIAPGLSARQNLHGLPQRSVLLLEGMEGVPGLGQLALQAAGSLQPSGVVHPMDQTEPHPAPGEETTQVREKHKAFDGRV